MSETRWERLAPLTGIAVVLLWLLALVVLEGTGDSPGDDPTAQELARYFENEEGTIYLGSSLFFLASALLVWFSASLRNAFAAAERGAQPFATIVLGAGVAAAALSMGLAAPQVSGAFAANESDAPLTPEAAQALWYAGDGFFVATEFAVAALLAAAALAMLRTRLLPAWLAWVSLVAVVVLVIPPIGWAGLIFVFPVWVVLVSVLLARRPAATEGREGAAARL